MSWAADLIKAQDGDVIIIPLALARALGLPAAAFLRQAAYLSAVVEDQHGWFFLEQEGPGNPAGKTIFERLGSWQATIGLGPDAQASIRRHLRALELLEENRKMVHGKLRYRVDSERYLNFLASCSKSHLSNCNARQTGNPDCTNRISGLNNHEKPDCTIGENRGDIYQEELPRRNTTTTAPQAPCGSGDVFNGLAIEPVLSPFLPQLLDILQQACIKDPAQAQDLLDELAGTIEAGNRGDRAKVGNPYSWLKALVGGDLKRARCFEIQARRLSAEESERQRKFAAAPAAIDPNASAKGAEIFAAARRRRQSQSQHS